MNLTNTIVLASLFLGLQEPAAESGKQAYLGASLSDVPTALAEHLEIEGGAIVVNLADDGPAEKAGLRRNDVLTKIGDESVANVAGVVSNLASKKPGDAIKLAVLRDGDEKTFELTLGAREAPAAPPEEPAKQPSAPEKPGPAFLGVRFGSVPPSVMSHLGIDGGVSVEDVLGESPAAKAGIKNHDILVAMGDEMLVGPADLPRLLGARKAGESVELTWIHRGKEKKASVILAERPRGAESSGNYLEIPGGGGLWFGGPRHSFRGKVFWKDADGKEHTFELPEFGVPDMDLDLDEFQKRFDEQFRRHWPNLRTLPDEFHERLERLLKRYHGENFAPRSGSNGDIVESRSEVSTRRVIRDGYDITIRDENGRVTVDVTKDGKSICKNLSLDEIDKLPADVRKRVDDVDGGKIRPTRSIKPELKRDLEPEVEKAADVRKI